MRIALIVLLFCTAYKNDKSKKILFLGDSITYAGDYITFIETYYHLNYPKEKIEFINVGLPSETVSGLSEPGHADDKFPRPNLHERLDRVISLIKPDIVYTCYGMNDGIYLPLDSTRFKLYKDGITKLHDYIISSGAAVIHVTPPVYDEHQGKAIGYANVLDQYSEWLLEQQKNGWTVVDLHFPMKEYLKEKRNQNESFALANDGIHPGIEGHWLMAKALLLSMHKQVPDTSFESFINRYSKAKTIYELVNKKQRILKDAYLTKSGHTRPGINTGIPLADALKFKDSINTVILSQR